METNFGSDSLQSASTMPSQFNFPNPVTSVMALAKVNLDANLIAFLVHLLTLHIVASFGASSGKQIRFCWLLQENIHIAFNLLGGRPIDFAIFLKILSLSMPVFSVLHLAQQDWYASSQLLMWHCSHAQLWVWHLACSQSHYRTLHPAPLRQWPTLLGPTHLEECRQQCCCTIIQPV